jgi:hypothetical protein
MKHAFMEATIKEKERALAAKQRSGGTINLSTIKDLFSTAKQDFKKAQDLKSNLDKMSATDFFVTTYKCGEPRPALPGTAAAGGQR